MNPERAIQKFVVSAVLIAIVFAIVGVVKLVRYLIGV